MAPSKQARISGEGLIYLSELKDIAHVSSSTFWSTGRQFPADACVELALTYVHFRRAYHVDENWDWEMETKSLVLVRRDSEYENYERMATFSIFSRFHPGYAPSRDILHTFGLDINEDTRQVTSTERTCYREFNIA